MKKLPVRWSKTVDARRCRTRPAAGRAEGDAARGGLKEGGALVGEVAGGVEAGGRRPDSISAKKLGKIGWLVAMQMRRGRRGG
jgi:hypothetical protein